MLVFIQIGCSLVDVQTDLLRTWCMNHSYNIIHFLLAMASKTHALDASVKTFTKNDFICNFLFPQIGFGVWTSINVCMWYRVGSKNTEKDQYRAWEPYGLFSTGYEFMYGGTEVVSLDTTKQNSLKHKVELLKEHMNCVISVIILSYYAFNNNSQIKNQYYAVCNMKYLA